ncbi:hypothetical protein KL905_002788 [Ogataea polymorpha]|uniref:uncharacterized protein n=1 Tax=Ogataea polymorpha TaxID=460523 RepID=UPI0007F542C2|nr:uncharacterized protein OGAPODRAFT_11182 [Ogataea polymorpha]KAG7921330.1 hypothetical protein KL905_002788 [Ogataea polymorpha]KAG7934107.1 hypothetical protein KL934_003029 [Ogataea polymorpha]OBA18656.1 hypothetical protein OGAPODRAFT_11182 [Ogataea polymorpha]
MLIVPTARYPENYEYALDFPKFLLIGDSITERCANPFPISDFLADGYDKNGNYTVEHNSLEFCFMGQLQHDYARRMDIINRGFSGYNSHYWRHMIEKVLRIEHDLSYSKCKVATLFLGTNDAAFAKPDGVPYDEFLDNMEFIIKQILNRDIKLVVIGPGHHYPDIWESLNPGDVEKGILRRNEENLKYSNGLKQLAEKFQVPFVDLYAAHEEYAKNSVLKSSQNLILDGIHFTGEGYLLLYQLLKSALAENYPEMTVPNLKMRLPDWNNFDSAKVEEIEIPALN